MYHELKTRLEVQKRILDTIDRRRREEDSAAIGRMLEATILREHLERLEWLSRKEQLLRVLRVTGAALAAVTGLALTVYQHGSPG